MLRIALPRSAGPTGAGVAVTRLSTARIWARLPSAAERGDLAAVDNLWVANAG